MTDLEILEKSQARVLQRQRRRLLAVALPAATALFSAAITGFSRSDYAAARYLSPVLKEIPISLPIIAALLLSLTGAIILYLETGFRVDKEIEEEVRSLIRKRSNERIVAGVAGAAGLETPVDTNAVRGDQNITTSTQSFSPLEMLKLLTERDLKLNAAAQAQSQKHSLEASKSRLADEVGALNRRGNVNLALGTVTSLIGVGILGYLVYSDLAANPRDMWSFIGHFAPRLTLVLFIELFAIFFLSLYKAGLAEIKYFQNEITNIEAKHAALTVALSTTDAVTIAQILMLLANTERNHILTKDQTTIELERARIDSASNGNMVKLLRDLWPNSKKAKEDE